MVKGTATISLSDLRRLEADSKELIRLHKILSKLAEVEDLSADEDNLDPVLIIPESSKKQIATILIEHCVDKDEYPEEIYGEIHKVIWQDKDHEHYFSLKD